MFGLIILDITINKNVKFSLTKICHYILKLYTISISVKMQL